jgi:L-asparaginase
MTILVITTGGTIGALAVDNPQNPPKIKTMPQNGRDFVCEALSELFADLKTRCLSLEPHDSQLIDEPYRNQLAKIIEEALEESILITHGTDTILKTADFLYWKFKANPTLGKKAVILTGAMVPLANGEQSDGYLNLAFSLNQLTQSGALAGIHIVLCDFEFPETESGAWKPRLYPYAPGKYEKKTHASDARYSRLISLPENRPICLNRTGS